MVTFGVAVLGRIVGFGVVVLGRIVGFGEVVLVAGVGVGVADARSAEEEGTGLVGDADDVEPVRGVCDEVPQAALINRTPRAKAVTLVARTDVRTLPTSVAISIVVQRIH